MKKIIGSIVLALSLSQQASANTYSWEDLVPPSSHNVLAFSNDRAPASGTRLNREAAEIFQYLDKGRIFNSRNALKDFIEEQKLLGVEIYDRAFSSSRGIIATRDNEIIFWHLMSQNVLHLETSDLRQCYLLYLDEWSDQISSQLKKYQYSQQAGRKRYTPSDEEVISSYEQTKIQLLKRIESETEGLRELYSNYEAATGDEKKALLREVSRKRAFIEHMEIRLTDMDRKLKPLKLEVKFPTPGHHTIIN
tara:strand:+ start:31 stop:780 length:750 start_codon:yes stop_codon:yes gene_type:complete